jgi:SecD/SecF fusion protein
VRDRRLLVAVAAAAAVATLAGVLVLRGGGGADEPGASPGVADPALAVKLRRLAFYDWEPNVIGPAGRPAPGDRAVTGGADAGTAGALALYDAVLRAARRPARVEPDNGRAASLFFAVDRARRRAFGAGAPSREAALGAVPADAGGAASVLEVRPGTALLRAEGPRERFYVLEDDVALGGSEIRDTRRVSAAAGGRQVIFFRFTEAGRAGFRELTREVARRGATSSLERFRDDPAQHNQHFAVVLDGQILTTPFVDFRRHPEGLDAAAGTRLSARLP